jgi:hypothetical protein
LLWLSNPKTLLLLFLLLLGAKPYYIIAEPYYIAKHYCITTKPYYIIAKAPYLIRQLEVIALIPIRGMLKRLKREGSSY